MLTTLFLLVLLAPLWISAVLVVLTYPLAWWVFPGGGSHGPGDTPALRLLGNVWAVLVEWVCGIWVALVVPLRGVFDARPRWDLPAGRRPVVVLPGYMENALTLLWLERRLGRELGVPVRALSPPRYWAGLEVLAEHYRGQILLWMAELGAERVDLVGHSMGGLIARMLSEGGGLRGRVGTVVTVAAPHLGSALSALAPGRNMRQMRRGSAFLEELNRAPVARGVRLVGICSTHDSLVLPWHCALSPRGDNFILRYRGHLTLIMSREVVRLIARELRAEVSQAPE